MQCDIARCDKVQMLIPAGPIMLCTAINRIAWSADTDVLEKHSDATDIAVW